MITEPILITGVGRRLGLHLSHVFLDRNIPVIGTFRTDRKSLIPLRQKSAHLIKCDFYNKECVASLIKEVQQEYKSIRAIIHNASDWATDSKDQNDSHVLQRMMEIHVHTPYLLNKAFTPLLARSEAKYADIIHVGDFVSSKGSKKHMAYAASKAAQDNLTLSFSMALGPKIKVNSIAPALMLFNEEDDDLYKQQALEKSIMGREGGYDEFRQAIDFLLGSQYITGRILPLDGGRHLK